MGNKQFRILLGKRLREIRENLGLTLREVAKDMGFKNYQVVSAIESGDRQLKATELVLLSRIYHTDFESLIFNMEKPSLSPLVLWRDQAEIKDVKKVEAIFLKLCENYKYLESVCGVKENVLCEKVKASTSDFNFSFVRNLANDFQKKMGLGDRPALSIHKVIKDNLGIKLLYLDLGNSGSGASTVGDFGSAILVNSNDVPWRRNFDIAHELFHIITWDIFPSEKIHCRHECGKSDRVEKYANAFASFLLLPRDILDKEFHRRLIDHKISFIDCIDMAKDFGVSTDALLYGLVNAKLVSRSSVSKVLAEGRIKSIDQEIRMKELQEREKPHLSERYISLAFKAFQKGYLSRGKLAEFLLVDRYDLPYLLDKNGFGEKETYDIEISSVG